MHYSIKTADVAPVDTSSKEGKVEDNQTTDEASLIKGGTLLSPRSDLHPHKPIVDSGSKMSVGQNQALTKKIQKIIKNSNLSSETKTELINDLVISHGRKTALQIQRKLPSGNQMLLSGGGGNNTQRQSMTDIPGPRRSETVAGQDVVTRSSNDTAMSANDDDDEPDDDNDDDDEENDDDDDDESDDDEYDNASVKDRSFLDQLRAAVTMIKVVSRSRNIRLSTGNFLALDKAIHVMKAFFSEVCSDGQESKDRRFLLKSNGDIFYQTDKKQIRMKLQKLLATLSFNTAKLFAFLQGISKKNDGVAPYSSDEKTLIRAFVSLSHFHRKYIPCAKVRDLCM